MAAAGRSVAALSSLTQLPLFDLFRTSWRRRRLSTGITRPYRKPWGCLAASCLVSTRVHSANERSRSVTAWWGSTLYEKKKKNLDLEDGRTRNPTLVTLYADDICLCVCVCVCVCVCMCRCVTLEAPADAWWLRGGCERGGTQPASPLPLHRPPAVHQIQTCEQRVSCGETESMWEMWSTLHMHVNLRHISLFELTDAWWRQSVVFFLSVSLPGSRTATGSAGICLSPV